MCKLFLEFWCTTFLQDSTNTSLSKQAKQTCVESKEVKVLPHSFLSSQILKNIKQWLLVRKFCKCKFWDCGECWCCDLPDSPTFATPCCADSPDSLTFAKPCCADSPDWRKASLASVTGIWQNWQVWQI